MKREVSDDGKERDEIEPSQFLPACSEKVNDVIENEELSRIRHRHVQPPPPSQGEGEKVKEEGGENRDPLDSGRLDSC